MNYKHIKNHNLSDDGTGFAICTDCSWNTGELLKFIPECQTKMGVSIDQLDYPPKHDTMTSLKSK